MKRAIITKKDVNEAISKHQKGSHGNDFQSYGDISESQGSNEALKPDNYLERIIKYIPIETISAYIFFQSIIAANINKFNEWFLITVIAFFIIGNILYLTLYHGIKRVSQLIICTLAFASWSYALGEPYIVLLKKCYDPMHTTLSICLITFVIPLFKFEKF